MMQQGLQIVSHLNEYARHEGTLTLHGCQLICSEGHNPGTRKCPLDHQRETGISRSTSRRIAKYDLKLKIFLRREVQQPKIAIYPFAFHTWCFPFALICHWISIVFLLYGRRITT